jgi:hypothetical protein
MFADNARCVGRGMSKAGHCLGLHANIVFQYLIPCPHAWVEVPRHGSSQSCMFYLLILAVL